MFPDFGSSWAPIVVLNTAKQTNDTTARSVLRMIPHSIA